MTGGEFILAVIVIVVGFILDIWWLGPLRKKRVGKLPGELPEVGRQRVKQLTADAAFARIHGQDDVIRIVKETIAAAQCGLRTNPDGPLASFLFIGPTGVGKTEIAYRIAKVVGQPIEKFDMGDFVLPQAAYRFTGAPPGYIGSSKPGQLAQAVIRSGSSLVLLLDEITQAHQKIWDVLMGLLDKGTFQDGSTGQWFDLRQKAVIVMTSNALENHAEELYRMSEEEVRDLLSGPEGWRDTYGGSSPFRRAFIGRVSRVIPFRPLSPEAIRAIVRDRLDSALASLREKSQVDLVYGEDLIEEMVTEVRLTKYGVRQIDVLIYDKISSALPELSKWAGGRRYRRRGKLELVWEEEGA